MSTSVLLLDDCKLEVIVVSGESKLDNVLTKLLCEINKPDQSSKFVVGLSTELSFGLISNARKSKVAVLQICHGSSCIILQLLRFTRVPESLYNFLALPEITFVGVGITEDVARLKSDYGFECRNVIELGPLAASVRDNHRFSAYGVLDLYGALKHTRLTIPSNVICGSWSNMELSKVQIQKAATNVFAAFIVGNILLGGYFVPTPSTNTSNYYDYD